MSNYEISNFAFQQIFRGILVGPSQLQGGGGMKSCLCRVAANIFLA
jgi:hypothetical protein